MVNATSFVYFLHITSQITGRKKQSEATLFAVRVHLPCYALINFKLARVSEPICTFNFTFANPITFKIHFSTIIKRYRP